MKEKETTQNIQEKLRVSIGTAVELGLENARNIVAPTTAYLLLDKGCLGQCSFCPRNNGNSKELKLSRILWPEFSLPTVLTNLDNFSNRFRRICLQTSYNPDQESLIKKITQDLTQSGKPLCVTVHPAQTNFIPSLLESGAEKVGIGLDAASKRTYEKHKGRPWENDFEAVLNSIKSFPNKIGIHLIFGLGDSEIDFVKMIQFLHQAGCSSIALFAFTPTEKSSVMKPPDLSAYRRIQAFRHLNYKRIRMFENLVIMDERISSFGIPESQLIEALLNGEAFQTSGCPDCNRPFYNESPRGIAYNFPRPLSKEEFFQAVKEMDLKSNLNNF
ncbi:MAG: hypothetical protein HQM08_03565 [Candidatus Riflebacteria bacterium]|nr:hypothetical protein [Candidatus Riflebacteria bacterium]